MRSARNNEASYTVTSHGSRTFSRRIPAVEGGMSRLVASRPVLITCPVVGKAAVSRGIALPSPEPYDAS